MMRSLLIFSAALFICGSAVAQSLPAIQTDRPDQTECPFTVPAKYIQVETGFGYEKADASTSSFTFPSVLWKYGLNDRLEFRLITELESIKQSGNKISGLNPVTVGFKTNIVQEHGILPMISFIGHLTIPDAAGKDLKATYYAPAFRFTMQHTLSEKVSLGYNLGAEWDGESPEPTFIYTLTSGFALSEKFGSFIELYGFAPQKGKADHRFDAGLTYLFNSNVMADLSGGVGLTPNAPDYFISAGFSFRFKTCK
jgi:hypothetical protein